MLEAYAQFPMMKGMGNNAMMNMGHFYGKLVDSMSGKPIEFASVSLWGNKWDTAARESKYGLLAGMITPANGNFSLENLPVMGDFTLKISFIGYTEINRTISFNLDMGKLMKQGSKQDYSSMLNALDKDLGNIKLKPAATQLKEVVVDGTTPIMELKLDKKVFNVDKSLTSTGGTAQELMKSIPSVLVDIDGNVTLRNATPQIFVDGKPTTLTLDQIPSDAIESIEIITNPSAKYDASGGQGGILNIVLKKARRFGYNGNVRAGLDMRGKFNIGGDINSREGKVNLFISAMYNQRKSVIDGQTDRNNLLGMPLINTSQSDQNISNGHFAFGRAGMDWFIDNRNTITISAMYPNGFFEPTDAIHARTDLRFTNPDSTVSSLYERNSATSRKFSNLGGALQYKHLFPKAGKELTADLNYNTSVFNSTGDYSTQYYDINHNAIGLPVLQKLEGSGSNKFYIAQVDFVNPVTEKMKVESGIRASIRDFMSRNDNFLKDSTGEFLPVISQTNNYNYTDEVYAAYLTFSHQINKFSYQIGLRAESSNYHGELLQSSQIYHNQYPLSLFPSASMTYSVSDKDDFQYSYSRRINRPNFFQVIPYTDYSDSLNLSRGNAALRPEFTNSMELSFLRNFNRNNNILITAWYKGSSDLITRFQINEYDTILHRNAIINTFENANSSYAYGLELTTKNAINKWMDLTSNINFFKSLINGTNLQSDLTNQQYSYFAKMSTTFKLPKDFSLQLSGDYQSKTSLPANRGGGGGYGGMGGGMGGGGGMMYGGGSSSTLQGYNQPVYGIDIALKYEFMKNKAASLTLNISDVLKTKKTENYTASNYFTQTTTRIRDQQFLRLNFSYRFGKFDVSLFKRKNMKVNTDSLDGLGM